MKRRQSPLTVIHFEHDGAELEVAGRVHFGEPARTYGPPDQCDPGSDDEVDDISVLRNGDKLSDEVVEKLGLNWDEVNGWLIEHAKDDYDDGPDPEDC